MNRRSFLKALAALAAFPLAALREVRASVLPSGLEPDTWYRLSAHHAEFPNHAIIPGEMRYVKMSCTFGADGKMLEVSPEYFDTIEDAVRGDSLIRAFTEEDRKFLTENHWKKP